MLRSFSKNENNFLSYWNEKEDEFVKYSVEYKDRAGMQVAVQNLKIKTCLYICSTLLLAVWSSKGRHKHVGRKASIYLLNNSRRL